MTVQTIPAIEDMTPLQRVELMAELWQEMSRHPGETDPPAWHRDVLDERERMLTTGKDEFVDLEVALAELDERVAARRDAR